MPHDIFISYSRRDLAAVKPIKEELERLGFSCWMDLEGIESGSEEFTEKIAEAIGESTAVLFFLSTASQASRWSLNELRLARSKGRRIVLVRFNKEPMQDKFILEFGGSDIIDWRTSEQREKLGRDLSRWTGKGNDAAPSFNFGDSDVGGWRILERVRKLKRDFCRWMIRKTRTTIIGQGRDAHISKVKEGLMLLKAAQGRVTKQFVLRAIGVASLLLAVFLAFVFSTDDHSGKTNESPDMDSDGDGIADSEEIARYGTDPFAADSDGDGFSDGNEVLIYGTNPLIPDIVDEIAIEEM